MSAAERPPEPQQVTIVLSPEDYELLEQLVGNDDGHANVACVVEHLAQSAADGIRRPGSWEREWLRHAFLLDRVECLQRDPLAPWRVMTPSRAVLEQERIWHLARKPRGG